MSSLTDAGILAVPDGVSFPVTFLSAQSQLMRTRVIYTCIFGVNTAVVGNIAGFVSRMKKEEHMLLDYMMHYAAPRLEISFLIARWVHIPLLN